MNLDIECYGVLFLEVLVNEHVNTTEWMKGQAILVSNTIFCDLIMYENAFKANKGLIQETPQQARASLTIPTK